MPLQRVQTVALRGPNNHAQQPGMPVPKVSSRLKKQARGNTTILVQGNNSQSSEDQQELVRRRVELQNSIALASRAIWILNSQPDPETLDLHPYSLELNDALLHELAKQLHANVKYVTKDYKLSQVQAQICSTVILSGCEGFSPVRKPAALIPVAFTDQMVSWLGC